MQLALSKFLYVVGKDKSHLVLLLFLFLLASSLDTVGIGLIGPFITLATNPDAIQQNSWLRWIYQGSRLESEKQFIVAFGLIITSIFYVKSFLSFRIQRSVFKFSFYQKGNLQKRLLKAYLNAEYTFHLNKNSALLIQNILQETSGFCNGVMIPLLNAVSYTVIIFCLTFLLVQTNPTATIFVVVVFLLPLLLYQQFKHKLTRWGKEGSIAQVGMLRTINHSLGGLKETKILGCEAYFEKQLDEYVQLFEEVASASQSFKLIPRILIEAVLITFLVGFTSISLVSNQGTQNLTATLGVFAVASIRLIPSISQLTNSIASLRNNSYGLNRLYFDLKEIEGLNITQPEGSLQAASSQQRVSIDHHKQTLTFNQEISLQHVVFSYPSSDEPVVRDISLVIQKGQSIALIGRSGAGKTTLVDIILGLLTPNQGDIQVDGTSIYSDVRAWQNFVGYIPQSIFLMDDTVRKNIAFGVAEDAIDPERLDQAIRSAQLTDLIEDLPDGVNTVIGERGVRLSGGQRQRIGIARALYHEREILILDEATAALDNETEQLITEAIQALSGTKTLIIIAHRLTTVEHCDRIYQLEKGRIAKAGSYREIVLGEAAGTGS